MDEILKRRIPCSDCAREKRNIELIGKEEFVSCDQTADDPKICLLVTKKKAAPQGG